MGKEPLHKYGCPLYGVAWAGDYVYMCGGGNLGIENKIVVATSTNGRLSDEVVKLNVGSDAPYRMAMHPSGRALALGLTLGGLSRVAITLPATPSSPPTLTLMSEETDGADTKRFTPIKSLGFSSDGRALAIGGEDGGVEIVAWPSCTRLLYWQASPSKAIRNVDFSGAHSDGVVFTVDESGACKVWDASSGEEVAQLQLPADMPRASFFRCKSVVDEAGIALYTAVRWKGNGYVLRWRQDEAGAITLEARSPSPVTRAPICGFDVSHSGRLIAAVTPDGDQCIVSADSLRPVKVRRGAHMTFATAVAFSPDDGMVVSTSADASATVTRLGRAGSGGLMGTAFFPLLALLIALLAVLVGVMRYWAMQEPDVVAQRLTWLGAQQFFKS